MQGHKQESSSEKEHKSASVLFFVAFRGAHETHCIYVTDFGFEPYLSASLTNEDSHLLDPNRGGKCLTMSKRGITSVYSHGKSQFDGHVTFCNQI